MQTSRLPIFKDIHKKGIAEEKERRKQQEKDIIKRDEDNRRFWKDNGYIDHNLDQSDASTDDEVEGGGEKKNRKYRKYRKYTIKTIKNKIKRSKRSKRSKKWSLKYKKSINCRRPRGFSQRQYCKYGRK